MDAYPTRGKDPRFYGLLICLVVCVRTGLVYLPPVKTAVRLPGSLGELTAFSALMFFGLAWLAAACGCAVTAFTGRRTLLYISLPAGPAFIWAAAYMVGAPWGPRGWADVWTGLLFLCIAGLIVCFGLVKPLEPRVNLESGH